MRNVLLATLLLVCMGSVHVLFARSPQAHPDESVVLFGPTGTKLLEYCSDFGTLKEGETVSQTRLARVLKNVGLCEGYIAGVNDAAIGYGSDLNSMKALYCVPPNAEMEQLIRVVKKSLEDNPSQLHFPASALVVHALKNAFPCK